jgi:hypothetical protein
VRPEKIIKTPGAWRTKALTEKPFVVFPEVPSKENSY